MRGEEQYQKIFSKYVALFLSCTLLQVPRQGLAKLIFRFPSHIFSKQVRQLFHYSLFIIFVTFIITINAEVQYVTEHCCILWHDSNYIWNNKLNWIPDVLYTLQVLLGCGNLKKKKTINCWVCFAIYCQNSYLFLPKICTFWKNLNNELKCRHENEVWVGDGKLKFNFVRPNTHTTTWNSGPTERFLK